MIALLSGDPVDSTVAAAPQCATIAVGRVLLAVVAKDVLDRR